MLSAEEISGLKKTHHALEERMEKIGKAQCHAVVELSKMLKELMDEIESTREKGKTMWNPAVITRVKLAKKGIKLAKDLGCFEMGVAGWSGKGGIPEEEAKRFAAIARLIREDRMPEAKKEFRHFEEIMELGRAYEKSEGELKEEGRALKREQLRIGAALSEMSSLETEKVDLEKARRHGELLENLEKLNGLREAHIRSMLAKPVAELLADAEDYSLADYCPAFPGREQMAELRAFFSEYPEFGRCSAARLCGLFGYSEKKLSHICPETSKFRRVVAGHRDFFEELLSIERTAFLAADGVGGKALDSYAGKVEGAQDIVARIRELGKDRDSCREEYEKKVRIEKRREELSKYSRQDLEAQQAEIARLLGTLHSPPEGGAKGTGEKTPGPLSGFGALLRRISGGA